MGEDGVEFLEMLFDSSVRPKQRPHLRQCIPV